MSDETRATSEPRGELLLYQTQDGGTRIQCRFVDETIWLSQAQIADLFQISVATVNQHLRAIYEEGELSRASTIRKYQIVRSEGKRRVSRDIEHYSLDSILAVGYRVRSDRGTQFRHTKDRTSRKESERFKSFTYEELAKRDKVNLDIFWLKDEALEESANLPAPEVIAADITADLEAALEQFAAIAEDLK